MTPSLRWPLLASVPWCLAACTEPTRFRATYIVSQEPQIRAGQPIQENASDSQSHMIPSDQPLVLVEANGARHTLTLREAVEMCPNPMSDGGHCGYIQDGNYFEIGTHTRDLHAGRWLALTAAVGGLGALGYCAAACSSPYNDESLGALVGIGVLAGLATLLVVEVAHHHAFGGQ